MISFGLMYGMVMMAEYFVTETASIPNRVIRATTVPTFVKFGSRKIVLKRIPAGQAACSLVSGQFNDEKFNSDII